MSPHVSAPDDLVLHGPRVLGFASPARVAQRFALDRAVVEELLATLGIPRGAEGEPPVYGRPMVSAASRS